ncbi:MAG TPA: enoyl-CoA hydratase-related protein [Spongiibacteraceae bacterium]|jgi:enoyl-CoA hydratase/carnithine racemase|nr:enoyl-CoA hydratase-related protein [Spongiibacteraceae bacterium]HUH38081.1 enoyl-CoA hydratase-related protein [Spongiibacteraceae bacterium]
MSDTVLQQREAGVLTLTLNRPARKNAFNIEQWIALRDALLAAASDNSVHAVLLTGAGANFSSGVDLNDMANAGEDHPFDSCAKAVAYFDKPLIGAASGVAVGGGATLLLHCDVIYVGDSLRMRFPFVNLGLVPEFASSYLLQAIIGARRAAELMYTAEWIDAARAVETGIATARFADDVLVERALEKAREIAQWPLNALRETKRTLKAHQREGLQRAFDVETEGMRRQAGSPENIEAIMAFLEKRAPRW